MKQGEIESCLPLLLPFPGMWHMNHGAALSLTGSMNGARTFPSSRAWKQESVKQAGQEIQRFSSSHFFLQNPTWSMQFPTWKFTNSTYQKAKNTNPNQNQKTTTSSNRISIETENKIPCPILKLYIKSKAFICNLLSFLHQKVSSSSWLSSSQSWS